MAWLIDPSTKIIKPISYERYEGNIIFDLIGPAYMETIHPNEYNIVKDILEAENVLHIAPYTVKKTAKYVYKVWAKDLSQKNGLGIQFYNTNSVFYDKVILVKYNKITLPELPIEKLLVHLQNPNLPLFYEPAKILTCKNPEKNIKWMNEFKDFGGYILDDFKIKDLMFKCTYCGECCECLKCAKCKKAYYCNQECQKNDWKNHKKICSS